MRVSGELAIRGVNFMRSKGFKPDETILYFDGKMQLIHLENLAGEWLASVSYNKPKGKKAPLPFSQFEHFNQRKKVR